MICLIPVRLAGQVYLWSASQNTPVCANDYAESNVTRSVQASVKYTKISFQWEKSDRFSHRTKWIHCWNQWFSWTVSSRIIQWRWRTVDLQFQVESSSCQLWKSPHKLQSHNPPNLKAELSVNTAGYVGHPGWPCVWLQVKSHQVYHTSQLQSPSLIKTNVTMSPLAWLLEKMHMSALVLQERSVLLRKWFELLTLHKDDLAKLITFECVSTVPLKGPFTQISHSHLHSSHVAPMIPYVTLELL